MLLIFAKSHIFIKKLTMKTRSAFIAALIVCQTSCVVEDYNLSDLDTENLELSTSVTAPVGHCSISITDLLDMQNVEGLGYDENGLLVFTYDTTQHFDISGIKMDGIDRNFTFSNYELLKSPIEEQGYSQAQFLAMGNIGMTLEKNTKLPINVGIPISELYNNDPNVRLDSILMKESPLFVDLTSQIGGLLDNSDVTYSVILNGKELQTATGPANKPLTLDLSGKFLRIGTADSLYLDGYLTMKNKMVANIETQGNGLAVHVFSKRESFSFEKAWGIFNNIDPMSGYNPIEIDVFEKNKQDGVDYNLIMENPQIKLEATTNIGVPLHLEINELSASNATETRSAFFNNGSKQWKTDLDYATVLGTPTKALDQTFDKDNGRIDMLLNMLPNQMAFGYDFSVVKKDMDSKESYFVTDDAYIDLKCNVNLPIYLRKGSYISLHDTITDIEIEEDLGEVYSFETAKIVAEVENGLPFDADIEFQFVEADTILGIPVYYVIDDPNIHKTISVKAAKTNSNDEVEKPLKENITIQFSTDDIPNLKKTKFIYVNYKIAVKEFEKVKVTKDNMLNIKLKAYAKGNVFINKL